MKTIATFENRQNKQNQNKKCQQANHQEKEVYNSGPEKGLLSSYLVLTGTQLSPIKY